MSREHDRLIKTYPDTLILRLVGRFFTAYEDSARVLSVLMGYKIRKITVNAMPKTNFPADDTLDKVVRILDAEHVNYVVFEKENVIANADFPDNGYRRVLGTFNENEITLADNRRVPKYMGRGNADVTSGQKQAADKRKGNVVHEITVHCSGDVYKRLSALASKMGIEQERAMEAAVGLAISSGLMELGY